MNDTRNVKLRNKDSFQIYFAKKSREYQKIGYKFTKLIKNRNMLDRIFAFLIDLSFMLFPILLWEIFFLLIIGGILPVTLFSIISWITAILLFFSVLVFPSVFITKTHGQSLGKLFYNLKVVGMNRQEAINKKLVVRELFGNAFPIILILFILSFPGLLIYWGICFIFVLLNRNHRLWIDFFTKTQIVVLHPIQRKSKEPQVKSRVEESVAKQIQRDPFDLFVHSNFSDYGTYSVEEIFQIASQGNISTLSICDRNCVKANIIASRLAPLYNIQYIPGVMFHCKYEGIPLKVIGYCIDYTNEIYEYLENENLKKEQIASLTRISLFENFSGLKIDREQLLSKNRSQRVTGRMIIQHVLNNPMYHDQPLIQTYKNSMNPIAAMYHDLFTEHNPCYVEEPTHKFKDIKDIIQLTQGKCFIIWNDEIDTLEEEKKEELLLQVDGIQVFMPTYTNKEMAYYLSLAKKYQLFVGAGSDFYGNNGFYNEIGVTNCPQNAYHLVTNFIDLYYDGNKEEIE